MDLGSTGSSEVTLGPNVEQTETHEAAESARLRLNPLAYALLMATAAGDPPGQDPLPWPGDLQRFIEDHPKLFISTGRRTVPVARFGQELLEANRHPDQLKHLISRLELVGRHPEALMLLAWADSTAALLQDRLQATGTVLLGRGNYELVRELVDGVPASRRWPETRILDAAAALELDGLQLRPGDRERVSLPYLDELAALVPVDSDSALALAGLRTEYFRLNGDPTMVPTALHAITAFGPLPEGDDAGTFLAGRSLMAQRGMWQVISGLGAAALFSGDAGFISEGRRLLALAYQIAAWVGVDPLPLKAELSHSLASSGIEPISSALAPLEAAVSLLRSQGHPRAVNLAVELSDVCLRAGDVNGAITALAVARKLNGGDGPDQVTPGMQMQAAGIRLVTQGPSPDVDTGLEAAWSALIPVKRLRRSLPSTAGRVALLMLDFDDHERARRWIERAKAVNGTEIQSKYVQILLSALETRARRLQGDLSADMEQVAKQCEALGLMAGALDARCTGAWDDLRHGDDTAALDLLNDATVELEPLWSQRFASFRSTFHGSTDPSSSRWYVRVLVPALVAERNGVAAKLPNGKVQLLLAVLIGRGTSMPVEQVCAALWPSADESTGRNRFHQLVLRLRRALDDSDARVVCVQAGRVWLSTDHLDTDLWRLRRPAEGVGDDIVSAIAAYVTDFCESQFPYEEALDDYRWEARNRLISLVERGRATELSTQLRFVDAVQELGLRLRDETRLRCAVM